MRPSLLLALTLVSCVTAATGSGAAPLDGVDWRLLDVGGRPALTTTAVQMRFAADSGRVSGDAGCNRFAGPYVRDGASLRLGPLVSTRRACIDDGATRQEMEVLAALEATRRHAITGDTLVLSGDAGVVARWVRTVR
ncbi:MAG: META domain-containing protein [Gemmatirosa sp.]